MNRSTSENQKGLAQLASQRIYTIRGQRVILDADIADFFERPTSTINQQRQRNQDRFPDSYAFQLTHEEWAGLKSQFVISSSHGGRRKRPWAYTEHGFAMLSTRLRGEQAARISKIIIDTFVSYRNGSLPAERVLTGNNQSARRQRLQEALFNQMEMLLQMELPTGETATTELKTMTAKAVDRMKAVLDAPAKKNEHISAEIGKLEAETAKLYAEAQKVNAESANIWADTFQKRLKLISQLREMAAQLERDDVLEALDATFGNDSPAKLT